MALFGFLLIYRYGEPLNLLGDESIVFDCKSILLSEDETDPLRSSRVLSFYLRQDWYFEPSVSLLLSAISSRVVATGWWKLL